MLLLVWAVAARLNIPTYRVGTPFAYLDVSGSSQSYAKAGSRVALVKPVFSVTAYSPPSFYQFYTKYGNYPVNQTITSDLNLLNVSVVDSWDCDWGCSWNLNRYVTSQMGDYGLGSIAAQSLTVLSDIDVTGGALFNQNGSSRFDVVVLGFSEYVTSQEYYAYQHFVSAGGRLIFMDASNFVAEVRYYPQTNHVALVRGHNWSFDGKKAWRDVPQRWSGENTNWIGSNQCCGSYENKFTSRANVTGDYPISVALRDRFGPQVFSSYKGHEENSVTNFTDTTILARWPSSSYVIAAYIHRYINGTVVHMGIISSDVVAEDTSVQFFLLSAIRDSMRP